METAPVELLELICDSLEDADVISLSHTCRTLQRKLYGRIFGLASIVLHTNFSNPHSISSLANHSKWKLFGFKEDHLALIKHKISTESLSLVTYLELHEFCTSDANVMFELLALFPNLKELIISNCRFVKAGVTKCNVFGQLNSVTLRNVKGLDDYILNELTRLECFAVTGCELIQNLQYSVDMTAPFFTLKGLLHCLERNAKTLKSIALNNLDLSESFVKKILDIPFPLLESFCFVTTGASLGIRRAEELLASLCSNVTTLDLSESGFSINWILDNLPGSCHKLKSLTACNNTVRVPFSGVLDVSKMNALTHLNISQCTITSENFLTRQNHLLQPKIVLTIDVSKNTALKILNISNLFTARGNFSELTLILSNDVRLKELNCSGLSVPVKIQCTTKQLDLSAGDVCQSGRGLSALGELTALRCGWTVDAPTVCVKDDENSRTLNLIECLSFMRVLDLSKCSFVAWQFDGVSRTVALSPQLTYLSLSWVSELTDKQLLVCLSSCRLLEYLDVSGCTSLSDVSAKRIVSTDPDEQLWRLRHLFLKGCSSFSFETLQTVPDVHPYLRSFTAPGFGAFEIVRRLHFLRNDDDCAPGQNLPFYDT